MLKHIKELEKRSNQGRTEYIKNYLKLAGVSFEIQKFRQRILNGENIIITDFCKQDDQAQLLLTAHTNKYFSSPGANDNASGVVVLLNVIDQLKALNLDNSLNTKIVFFDHEDGLAYIDGSTYFVNHTDSSKISFVFNLDGVGVGNAATISPKITESTVSIYTNYILELLKKLDIKYFSFDLPPLLIEDHIPFTDKNVPAISFNLMPEGDLDYLINMERKSSLLKLKEVLWYRGINRKKHPMFIMRHRHNDWDISEYIDKLSLELCKKIVMDVIKFHRGRSNN